MGAAGSKCLATRIDHRAPEKLTRRIRAHGLGSALEKKTGARFGGGRDSHSNHSQTQRIAGAFRGRHGVSNSLFAFASGDCHAAGGARAGTRKGVFSDHAKTETLPVAPAVPGPRLI